MANSIDTLFNGLSETSKGFAEVVSLLQTKITPELLDKLSDEDKRKLDVDMAKISEQSTKISEIPDMLKKAMDALKSSGI